MLQNKTLIVFFMFFAIGFLPAQEFDKSLYTRAILGEISVVRDKGIDHFKVDARFVRSFLWWTGELWEIETLPNSLRRITGIRWEPVPGLIPPEEGQIVTFFIRWIPEEEGSMLGETIIEYWVATD